MNTNRMQNRWLMGLAVCLLLLTAVVVPGRGPTGAAAAEREAKFPERWRSELVPPFARDVQLSADGKQLLVGWGRGVRLWDLDTGHWAVLHHDTQKGVNRPRLSPDGRWVVGSRGLEPDWALVVWDAATGREVRAEPKVTRKPGDYRLEVLGFDPVGGAWVVRPTGVVERVELPAGKVTSTIRLPFAAESWTRLVLSPDGRRLARGGGTAFAVRPTDPGADWGVVERHAKPGPTDDLPDPTRCPVPCGFSPDGRRLVTYDMAGGVVAIWDLDGKPVPLASRKSGLTLLTHLDDLTFTPDGKRFAFVATLRSQDRAATQLRVWDAATLAEVSRVAPPGGVDGFAFTPDGKRVVLTHPDGTLTVWNWVGGK